MTARLLARVPPETLDRIIGGIVIGFAAVGLLAFVLFILVSLGIGGVRLVQYIGGL